MQTKKNLPLLDNLAVYAFNTFDEFLEFCSYLHTCFPKSYYSKFKKTALYKYNKKYYLYINVTKSNLKSFKNIHCSLIEFSTYTSNSELFKRKLTEYGTPVFISDSINLTIKYFCINKYK